VALQAVRVGSFDIDAAIQTYIRREYGIAVGERTAEDIKVAIGSAFPVQDDIKAEVRGRDLMSGLPKNIILSPEDYERLSALAHAARKRMPVLAEELADEIARAHVLARRAPAAHRMHEQQGGVPRRYDRQSPNGDTRIPRPSRHFTGKGISSDAGWDGADRASDRGLDYLGGP